MQLFLIRCLWFFSRFPPFPLSPSSLSLMLSVPLCHLFLSKLLTVSLYLFSSYCPLSISLSAVVLLVGCNLTLPRLVSLTTLSGGQQRTCTPKVRRFSSLCHLHGKASQETTNIGRQRQTPRYALSADNICPLRPPLCCAFFLVFSFSCGAPPSLSLSLPLLSLGLLAGLILTTT